MYREILSFRGLLNMLLVMVVIALLAWLGVVLLPMYSRQVLGVAALIGLFAIGVVWGVNRGDPWFLMIMIVGMGLVNVIGKGNIARGLILLGLRAFLLLAGYMLGRAVRH